MIGSRGFNFKVFTFFQPLKTGEVLGKGSGPFLSNPKRKKLRLMEGRSGIQKKRNKTRIG